MALETYRKKRHFDRTPEPAGGPVHLQGHGTGSYLIQKHAATRLHYDFRLELDGVLLSWAVPKGPSLNPADKRLAMHVEDHPIEYGTFEGVIPKGEYGGGTVMLWDRGTWTPVGDPRAGMAKGHLEFELQGERLSGRWHLVRKKAGEGESGEPWFLFKGKDDLANADEDVTAVFATSVATGRTMEQIAAARDRVWSSTEGEVVPPPQPPSAQPTRRPSARQAQDPSARQTGIQPGFQANRTAVRVRKAARLAPPPDWVPPQLATLALQAPDGDGWVHEIKLDGYRAQVRIDGPDVRVRTRSGKDWTDKFGGIAQACRSLPVQNALLDGEVVALKESGVSDFQLLANRLGKFGGAARQNADLVLYLFDLLWLDGEDLRGLPLLERKARLQALLVGAPASLRFSDHLQGHGPAFWKQACQLGLEGVLSKRADGRYDPVRTRGWLKVKCLARQEFVIVGWTDPQGSRQAFGALLLGVYDAGRLHYAGRVGTGFSEKSLQDLMARLRPLHADEPPVVDPPTGVEARGAHWVQPQLVAEVAYTEWTTDKRLRHPTFQGLRLDKPPVECVRERAVPVQEPPPPPTQARRGSKDGMGSKDGKGGRGPMVVGGVRLTSPDRVLWPDAGLTKLDLAEFYTRIADRILPHVVGRPLTLVRCPDGAGQPCFYQKHQTETMPPEVRGVVVDEKEGKSQYVWIDGLPGLLALVQMGVLEVHPWGARNDRLDRPDRLVFDLDPDPALPWPRLVEVALLVRAVIERYDLEGFVKTTGGKGLHVVVPIARTVGWDEVKAFCKGVAELVVRAAPDRTTAVMAKAKRTGKVFVDWLRNGQGATAVATWSTRARPGAPVAVPLDWAELATMTRPDPFHLSDVGPRLQQPDPWPELAAVKQTLSQAALRELAGRR